MFTLNLNIELRTVSDAEDSLYLSPESRCLLAFTKYCHLKPNQDFYINIYYSKLKLQSLSIVTNTEFNTELCERLNRNYTGFNFNVYNSDEIQISCNILDIDLPSLTRKTDDAECNLSITGLASLCRDIVKLACRLQTNNKKIENLLGYKNNCLKACSESSKWTYLCETMTVKLCANFTFELFREFLEKIHEALESPLALASRDFKNQKQRSETLKLEENLNLSKLSERRFLEDHFITIADLIVFYFLTLILGRSEFRQKLIQEIECEFSLICLWYEQMKVDHNLKETFLSDLDIIRFNLPDEVIRSNQKGQTKHFSKRKFTKSASLNEKNDCNSHIDSVINELTLSLKKAYNLDVPLQADQNLLYNYEKICLNWSEIDEQASPAAGGLPWKRIERKCQQLENFLFTFKSQIYTEKQSSKTIVDFCSGGGHLGILIAYMFPKCTVKLVENKEESLRMATKRIAQLKLTNCLLYKGNLTNFVGNFDVGLAIHACGSSTDLIIEKCVNNKADLLISPCCYGSIKENDLIKYPRSREFQQCLKTSGHYGTLLNYADRTELGKEYAKNANVCMSLIDTDRLLYLKSYNYGIIQLSKLLPETCSTKNNLILAKNIS